MLLASIAAVARRAGNVYGCAVNFEQFAAGQSLLATQHFLHDLFHRQREQHHFLRERPHKVTTTNFQTMLQPSTTKTSRLECKIQILAAAKFVSVTLTFLIYLVSTAFCLSFN